MENTDSVAHTGRGHLHPSHRECIKNWLTDPARNACPYCEAPVDKSSLFPQKSWGDRAINEIKLIAIDGLVGAAAGAAGAVAVAVVVAAAGAAGAGAAPGPQPARTTGRPSAGNWGDERTRVRWCSWTNIQDKEAIFIEQALFPGIKFPGIKEIFEPGRCGVAALIGADWNWGTGSPTASSAIGQEGHRIGLNQAAWLIGSA